MSIVRMPKGKIILLECIIRYNMFTLITSYDQQTISEPNTRFKQNMGLHSLFGKTCAQWRRFTVDNETLSTQKYQII